MGFLKRFRTLTDSSQRWKLYLLAGVLAYFITINQFITLRPDHVFFILFLFMFVLGGEKAKRFIIDWLPFIGFWIAYDMMRGVVDNWRVYIHIREVYDAEFFIFGRIFDNQIPAFWFQQFQYIYTGHLLKTMMDVIAANLYSFHFFGPLLLGWILWHTVDDRRMYYRFAWTFTILNVLALITFFLYPAAPPWYVLRFGFEQPSGSMFGTAGSLVNIDNMIKMKFFTNIWDNMNPNHFAAIPSLHGGYPIVISLFTYIKFKKYRVLLILYPVLTWWATLYTNHHYVIDLLIAAIYIAAAYWINHKILMPKVFDSLLFKKPAENKKS